MKRYWVPKEWIGEESIQLSGEVYKHIHVVCRNQLGSKFELLCEGHKAYFCELIEVEKKQGLAKILELREIPALPKPRIHLALSIPRFQKFDFIIEKAVELGVEEVHPFVSDFSFVRKIDSALTKKSERWKKIVQGATQQSGRGDLMEISSVKTLDDLLSEFNPSLTKLGLFPYEGECELGLREALNQLQGENSENSIDQVWLFVGSEGGFSHQEVEKFQEVGLEPVTLGAQVLRVDTACITLVAILKYHFSLMEG